MAEPINMVRSRDMLQRSVGGRDGRYPFLELGTWDVVHYFDDFFGDEVRGSSATPGHYEVVTGVDGAFDILADQQNGVGQLSASVGAGATGEHAGLALPELGFAAELSCVLAVRLQIDVLSSVKVEVGFTDVTTDAGAVNIKATPSFNADNAVVWAFDTDDSSGAPGWEGLGVIATAAATTYEAAIDPVAATFETMIVALRGNSGDTNADAKFIRLDANGKKTHESPWQESFITSTTKLVPWVFVQLRGSVDRNLQLDFIDVRQRRTVN